ncbi:TolC family protein [Variovorax sp. dw_308]|uniref:efflux transporter outer membrane subunit n=1 Tax=Variovorax sp. dw_308 TaxID=2721546 RepID=UPI001C437D1F
MKARRPIAIVAMASMAAISGCTLGPEFRQPPLPARSAGAFVSALPDAEAASEAPDAWWRLYDDDALARLVTEALDRNTDLAVAAANLALAEAVWQEARAGRYPTTTLTSGAVYGRNLIANSIAAAFKGHAENLTTLLGGIDVGYEIDLYGRVAGSIAASSFDVEATAAMRDVARVAVAAETTRAYQTVRSAGRELDVAQRSVAIAEQALAIVARQAAEGAASDFDVARVRVLADQARSQLPAFEGRRQAALFELAALLGRVPAEAPFEVAQGSTTARLPMPLPTGDGAALLARRPDVRQAERRLAAATTRIGVATAALYPRVSLGASLGFANNEVLRSSNAVSFAIGPLISWSFPDQAVARARIAQSDAAAAAALANFDGTVLRALKEVEQAITACNAETQRRASLADAEAHAADAYRLSGIRRREGALSQLDLLTVEQTLLVARAVLAAADTRIIDSQVSLFKALGGGWR